jgi:hypothetical protein
MTTETYFRHGVAVEVDEYYEKPERHYPGGHFADLDEVYIDSPVDFTFWLSETDRLPEFISDRLQDFDETDTLPSVVTLALLDFWLERIDWMEEIQ